VTARILRIELRRSAALWAALISVPVVLSYNQVGQGLSLIAGSQRGDLLSFIPLALGLGAWQARRDRRSRTEELVATTPRPRWQRLLPTAAALAVGAAAGSLLIFAGLAGYTGATGAYVSAVSVPFATVTAVYLLAAVWSGLALGRLLPWRLTPPLLVVGGSVALMALGIALDDEGGGGPAPGTVLLDPSYSNYFGPFSAYPWQVILAQGLWAAALAAAGLILYTASRYGRLTAIVPVALAVAAALPLLPRHAYQAQVLDQGAVALVCTPDAPRVCVTRVHHLALSGMREPSREALALLSAKLPQAPTSVVEIVDRPGTNGRSDLPPQTDTLSTWLMNDDQGRIAVPARDVLWSLLIGAGTQPCDNAPPGPSQERTRYDTARLVAAAWLLDAAPLSPTHLPDWWGGLPDQTQTLPAYDALRRLPADAQRARVAALRQAELACDYRDRLEILIGPGSPP
jgi:hypothetical protein